MKSLSKILIALLTIIFTGTYNHLYAQDIDNNRMNRDINIMENVLEEIFKTRWAAHGNTVRVAPSGNVFFGGSNDIQGTYLSDYGIIFSIPGGPPAFVTYTDAKNDKSFSYSFKYSDDNDSKKEVTEESIIQRIKEFLGEYGSTISQLGSDDKIMVIYKSPNSNSLVFQNSSVDDKKKQQLPTISVVAQNSDLKAYRAGSISTTELNKRLSVSTVKEDQKNKLDLRVMANIFETAFDDSEEERFHLRGDVDYLKLDNFGALFSFKVNYGHSTSMFRTYQLKPLTIRAGKIRLDTIRSGSFTFAPGNTDSTVLSEPRKHLQKIKEERKEKEQAEKEAYQAFLTNIKEYLVDYGRTLSSVSSDQHVLISATVSSRVDDIPERVDFQVKKSVLEAMDKGSMNREQAINQISVREY